MDETAQKAASLVWGEGGFFNCLPQDGSRMERLACWCPPDRQSQSWSLQSRSGCIGALLCHQAVPGHTVPSPLPQACWSLFLSEALDNLGPGGLGEWWVFSPHPWW